MRDRRSSRLIRVRFTRHRDQDVDDELQFHLDMRAAELVAQGRSEEEAREEALRQFGDLHDARAYCRTEDQRRMREYRLAMTVDNVRQDISLALRTMRRQPAFTMSTVLTLGVAIAIATSVYSVVHAYLIRPLPYPEPDRLVHVIAGPTRTPFPNAPSLASVDWTSIDSLFGETIAWDLDGYTLAGGDRPEFVDGAWVSAGYFRALGMQPAIGRGFSPEEYSPGSQVGIISDALWNRRFNRDRSIIGRTIRAYSTDRPNDNELVTVVGVMPAGAWHVSRFTDLLRPLSTPRFASMAQLAPGMSMREAEARLNAVILPQLGTVDPAWRMTLVSVQDEYTYQLRPTLIALLASALFLLLIGGASVAGAQTARAAARRAEIGVRVALGATRSRILTQLITESLVVATFAALVGAALTTFLVSAVGATVGDQLGAGVPGGAASLGLDVVTLGMAVGVGGLIGALFGLMPAVSAVSGNVAGAALGTKGIALSTASPTLRRGLIVAQVAFTTTLLIGAGLMARTLLAIGAEHPGFESGQVMKANLLLPQGRYPDAASRSTGADRILTRLSAQPGVNAVAIVSPHPFRGAAQSIPVTAEGRNPAGDTGPRAVQYVITSDYFDVMSVPLLRGRVFGAQEDALGTPGVIVSENLASELWPDEDALGRRVRVGRDTVWRQVVGVVGDTREPVESAQEPDVYLPYSQVTRAYVSIVARVSGEVTPAGNVLRRTVAEVDDVFALSEVEPLADVIRRDTRRHRALATILSAFGLFALAIAMLGLYASLSFVVAQRKREIAIRVAIGANASSIGGLVLREGALLVAFGVVAGALLSVAMTRMLSTLLYGISPVDPGTFAGIATLLGLSALAAAASPIRNAARVQPAEVLRAE